MSAEHQIVPALNWSSSPASPPRPRSCRCPFSQRDTFGWLNRDEEMPQTEQLPAGGRVHLGLLLGTLPARRKSGARPFTRYAAIVFYALVVAFWVSWIVMASASAHSASCPSGKTVIAPGPGTTITTCKLSS